MRVNVGLIGISGVLAVAGFFAAVLVAEASAHSNPLPLATHLPV